MPGAEPPPPPVAGAWLGRDGECACRDSASSKSFLGGNVEHSCLDMAGRFLLEVQQIKGLNLSVSGWGRDLLSLQAVKSFQQPMVLKTKVGPDGEEPLHQLKKDPLSKKRGFRVRYGKCILNNVIDII